VGNVNVYVMIMCMCRQYTIVCLGLGIWFMFVCFGFCVGRVMFRGPGLGLGYVCVVLGMV